MASRSGGDGGEHAAHPRGQRRMPPTEGAAWLPPARPIEGGCPMARQSIYPPFPPQYRRTVLCKTREEALLQICLGTLRLFAVPRL